MVEMTVLKNVSKLVRRPQGFDIGFAKLSERRKIFERWRIFGGDPAKPESAAGAPILVTL